MNRNRFWLELITLCAAVALLLALGFATIGAGATAAADKQAQPPAEVDRQDIGDLQKFAGVVSDSLCKGKHDVSMNLSASSCSKVCLKKGGQYALVDGDKVYVLQGATAYLDRVAGERVTITGILNGDAIKVASVQGAQR